MKKNEDGSFIIKDDDAFEIHAGELKEVADFMYKLVWEDGPKIAGKPTDAPESAPDLCGFVRTIDIMKKTGAKMGNIKGTDEEMIRSGKELTEALLGPSSRPQKQCVGVISHDVFGRAGIQCAEVLVSRTGPLAGHRRIPPSLIFRIEGNGSLALGRHRSNMSSSTSSGSASS